MSENVEKIAVNSRTSTTVPGNRNSRNPCAARGSSPTRKFPENPVPKSTQNTAGWTSAEITRLR
jgi:hypothetical protein